MDPKSQDSGLANLPTTPTVQDIVAAFSDSGVQNDQTPSGGVPCNSNNDDQQIKDKRDGFCAVDQNQKQEDLEPQLRDFPMKLGAPNPRFTGVDGKERKCSSSKWTLYCTGDTLLPLWVSNCYPCMFLNLLHGLH